MTDFDGLGVIFNWSTNARIGFVVRIDCADAEMFHWCSAVILCRSVSWTHQLIQHATWTLAFCICISNKHGSRKIVAQAEPGAQPLQLQTGRNPRMFRIHSHKRPGVFFLINCQCQATRQAWSTCFISKNVIECPTKNLFSIGKASNTDSFSTIFF